MLRCLLDSRDERRRVRRKYTITERIDDRLSPADELRIVGVPRLGGELGRVDALAESSEKRLKINPIFC